MPGSSVDRPGGAAAGVAEATSDGAAPAERALRLRHPARPAELRSIRGRVQDWADRHAVPEPALIDLQLALGEAVANGVEHAYRDNTPGTVEVDVEIRGSTLAVRVTDHGRWRPAPASRGHRGRGLSVIERLARGVVVSRTGRGTEVSFQIPMLG